MPLDAALGFESKASASFLKKRSKKLLFLGALAAAVAELWQPFTLQSEGVGAGFRRHDVGRPGGLVPRFPASAVVAEDCQGPQEQKFFASPGGAPFFQKRSACFTLET
jgi:hypothetical protein